MLPKLPRHHHKSRRSWVIALVSWYAEIREDWELDTTSNVIVIIILFFCVFCASFSLYMFLHNNIIGNLYELQIIIYNHEGTQKFFQEQLYVFLSLYSIVLSI
ncbi:hypothetical protein ACJX0J_040070 [Zea mays]